jgi:crotonobetainyl-CoA:carnitine CoA-transferase CaiB-like acyl-CoA transferase
LLDSALSALANQAQSALATGETPARLGNAHPSIVPYETFHAGDATVAIAAANDDLFRRLCHALELPGLAEDERFATNPGRVANRDALVKLLAGVIAQRTADDLLAALADAGVPSGRIRDVHDAFEAAARAGEPATFTVGGLELVRSAVRIDAGDAPASLPPPRLGEHTRAVLRALGRSDGEIDSLAERGVVQA